MHFLKKYGFRSFCLLIMVLLSCSKGENPAPGGGNTGGGGGGGTGGSQSENCVITTISQVNSGSGSESSLSVSYNSNGDVAKIVVYDSVNKTKHFESAFSYITADSVRIDPYQYIIRDASKRVIRFVTKSDMADPAGSNKHVFEYNYNSEGYLATKQLFINGSAKANFRTVYTYTNGRITTATMTTPSSGNLKVLESILSYDNSTAIKNWIYTFPDGMEGYPYLAVLNFGKRAAYPVTRIVTKIYNPATGSLMDTQTTDYGDYKIDAHGYVLIAKATGDWQQGLAAFYGKTNFYYSCN